MEKVKSILWYSREPRTALVATTNDADDDDNGGGGGVKEENACS
jgi:hypothetical protein